MMNMDENVFKRSVKNRNLNIYISIKTGQAQSADEDHVI